MERFAEIRITKSILLVPERVLWKYLPASEIEEGIRKGKGFKRAAACEKRQAHVDRWQLCEWLKGNRLTEDRIPLVETMNAGELREGIKEYLLSLLHSR